MTCEFKKDVEDGRKEMSLEIQDSLETFIKHIIFSRSIAIPEFENLKQSTRVSIFVFLPYPFFCLI